MALNDHFVHGTDFLSYFGEQFCFEQCISIYFKIQDSTQKLQNFHKNTNIVAATKPRVV